MNILTRVKIGVRLGISFALILVLLGIIALVVLQQMNKLTSVNERVINEKVKHLLMASQVNVEAEAAAVVLLKLLLTEDRDVRIALYKSMDMYNEAADNLLETLSKETSSTALKNVMSQREAYKSAFIETVELIEFDAEMAFKQFDSSTQVALTALLSGINTLVDAQQVELKKEHQLSQEANSHAVLLVVVLSLTALFLGILLAILVGRSIVKPLQKTVITAQEIANGVLAAPSIDKGGKDEVSELMAAFAVMCSSLNSLVSGIQQISSDVEVSAKNLATPVSSVKEGSLQQSDAVQRIVHLIADFVDEGAIAATTAQEAKQQSGTARELALEGQKLIGNATEEFTQISSTISGTVEAVKALSEQASSVRSLVDTVREIAEQTNLLALNAAIEAARAGESGRGFSVVADEVRALANRTERATSEINDVIDGIDRETQAVVLKIGVGQKELEQGIGSIQKIVKPLEDLNEGAQASFLQLERLEQVVSKQANDSNTIQQDLNQIGEMAGDSMAAADRVATTTDELLNVAEKLASQVNYFNVSKV